ncbi:protein-L-isoaspartate O-methyltransferase family protein [Microvirga guangxiensis]|uniref:Protein-L-isoaspartate O-methyltransferase n=1 Tax=Microvirga guangxiensis TaxID=549386 RepID=A0A1G5G5U2_9HYPH|nr:methyltransferase domain-containing protein [Microvirga guangxiensis]SCY46640.1 protein-L-isoaspartate(D-aspartate) O-methyltransferase [Microvirga guangxiensis]
MMESSFTQADMAVIRRAYAKQILTLAGIVEDARLEAAFAAIARERFLGDPPWTISRGAGGYEPLPSQDPVVLYQDVLLALASHRGVNNGSPSLHAGWLHALSLREGESVAHMGAGTGYYTAIIAELVGESGHVTAVEFNPELAKAARENLADRPNVTVVEGDGAQWPREDVDAVYVNFSVERPAEAWIDHLKHDGRLIFPLGLPRSKPSPWGGTHAIHGAGLRVTLREKGLAVQWLNRAFFVCAEGELSIAGQERQALQAAFEGGGIEFVRSLIWRQVPPPGRCWFTGSGWALCYDEITP